MPKKKKSTNSEMNKLIYDELIVREVDCEFIEINVDNNMCATVKGEVTSEKAHNEIRNVMGKFVDPNKIADRVIVIEDLYEDVSNDLDQDEQEKKDLFDENDDSGTEDVYKSIEDGIPYSPPDDPSFFNETRKKRRKH